MDQQLDDPLLDANNIEPLTINRSSRLSFKKAVFYKVPSCRQVLAIMASFGFFNIYALRVTWSVALVGMVNSSVTHNPNSSVNTECSGGNTTEHKNLTQTEDFHWDYATQGLILNAFFYGYIWTQFPGGWVADRFGGKRLFGFGVLCTAMLTFVTPLAAKLNVNVLIAIRVLEGLCEGVTFPAMHAMLAKWAPKYERSQLGGFVYSGALFGITISLFISGLLLVYVGWPSVFYVFGSLGIVWFIVWMLLTADSPATHPRISPEERLYIESNIGHDGEWLPTPWLSIFTSVHVWAIVVAHFCNNWGLYTLLTCLPAYMREVLHFDISMNGYLSALPYLVMWITMNMGGLMADFIRRRNYLSTGVIRKLFNGIGFLSAAVCLTLVTFTGDSVTLPLVLINIGIGIAGLGMSGFAINHLDIAPRFAGTLLGITNTVAVIPGIAAPYVVGILTRNNISHVQWRKVFLISSAIFTFGAIVFAVFASGEEQKWAKPVERYEDEHREEESDRGVVHYHNDDPLIT